MLRRLNDEYAAMLEREALSREFNAAVGEKRRRGAARVQLCRRAGGAKGTGGKKSESFANAPSTSSTPPIVIPEFGITIDEMLVYIPQLTKRKKQARRNEVQAAEIPRGGAWPDLQHHRLYLPSITTCPRWKPIMRASPTSLPTRSSRWTPSTTATPSSFPSERFPSRRTQCYESFLVYVWVLAL